MTADPPRIERLGEDALLLRFGETIDPATNARVHRAAARIAAARPHWLRDLVPAYATLALCVDPFAFDGPGDPLDAAEALLRAQAFDDGHDDPRAAARLHTLPVRYGGDDGPDLDDVARHAGLDPQEVIARHAAVEYQVAMLGFAAGFPYLIGMDPAIATPRLATPRTRVAAGSIGIGGAQTGIYPKAGPGGWRVIGRTSVALFDAVRAPPALFAPGDRVRFVAVGSDAAGEEDAR